MVKQESFQFNNNRSVRFNLESFALPIAENRKKNTIYTNLLSKLHGTKRKLLPELAPPDKLGYDHVAYWSFWVFTSNADGLYYSEIGLSNFTQFYYSIVPQKLCISNNRLFILGMNKRKIYYSVNLQTAWTFKEFLDGIVHIPEQYGICVDMIFFRNKLLVICENGLLTIDDTSFKIKHLSDDSEILISNINDNTVSLWESDSFSLGYATDTQTLREVFVKTDVSFILVVSSNKLRRTIRVKAGNYIQKIKTNLRGDQFKISIIVLSSTKFCISDLSAVVEYGKRS